MPFSNPFSLPESILSRVSDNTGKTLLTLSEETPLLLVFLRHLGCIFCLEALRDLRANRDEIRRKGVSLALVHLVSPGSAQPVFDEMELSDVPHFSDPEKEIYQAFGLKQGRPSQIFGPKVIARGAALTFWGGLKARKVQGDYKQMPGVFLLKDGAVLSGYLHSSAADRPDYCRLIDRSPPPEE